MTPNNEEGYPLESHVGVSSPMPDAFLFTDEQIAARIAEIAGTYKGLFLSAHAASRVAAMLPTALPTVPAATAVAGSGWVSCADRLPVKGEIVLIHRKVRSMNQEIGYAIHVAERWPDEYTYNTWRTEGGEAYGDFMVTHWQPLPTRPAPC